MTTFFGKAEVQYIPLTDDDDISMAEFLQASNGVVEFVGFLGGAFTPVKQDINGNIVKIDRVYRTEPSRYATITKLLVAEKADFPNKLGPATEALLWLKRGLQFLCLFLDLLVEDHRSGRKTESLAPIGKIAYETCLKQHHNMLARGLFAVIVHATPWRKDFLKTISISECSEDECIDDVARYLRLMRINVHRLMEMYKHQGLENYGGEICQLKSLTTTDEI